MPSVSVRAGASLAVGVASVGEAAADSIIRLLSAIAAGIRPATATAQAGC